MHYAHCSPAFCRLGREAAVAHTDSPQCLVWANMGMAQQCWTLCGCLLLLHLLFRELPQAWLALAKQIRFAHHLHDARRWRTLCCAGLMRGGFHHVLDFALGLA